MSNFSFHSIDSAPAASKPLLENVQKKFGFVPNLLGGMAEAPALLESYLTVAGIFNKTALTETERQVILMTNNRLNNCGYCMAAHTAASKAAGVPDDVIESLRTGKPIGDKKLQALSVFAAAMNESRGRPGQAAIDALLAAGYTQQTVLEVVVGTAMKVLSNYANHLMETPVDKVFAPVAWEPAMAEAA